MDALKDDVGEKQNSVSTFPTWKPSVYSYAVVSVLMQLHEQRNISQKEISARTGISRVLVSKMLNCKKQIKDSDLALFAEVYGVPLSRVHDQITKLQHDKVFVKAVSERFAAIHKAKCSLKSLGQGL